MLRFVWNEAGQLVLGLFGAALMAAAIATVSAPLAKEGLLPFVVAWAGQLNDYVHMQFGVSAITGLTVLSELSVRLPLTAGLLLEGMAVAVIVGVPLGFLFAASAARVTIAPLVQMIAAAPTFVASLALAYVGANILHWPVPINGEVKFATSILPQTAEQVQAILLPVLAVGISGAAAVQLALRRAAVSTGRERWPSYLRRMGLSAWEVEWLYVVPRVLAGVLSHFGEVVLALLSAAAVSEWVFSYPGAADLFVKSVALHDWSIAGAVLFVFAGLTMTAQFVGRCAARLLTEPGTPP